MSKIYDLNSVISKLYYIDDINYIFSIEHPNISLIPIINKIAFNLWLDKHYNELLKGD